MTKERTYVLSFVISGLRLEQLNATVRWTVADFRLDGNHSFRCAKAQRKRVSPLGYETRTIGCNIPVDTC